MGPWRILKCLGVFLHTNSFWNQNKAALLTPANINVANLVRGCAADQNKLSHPTTTKRCVCSYPQIKTRSTKSSMTCQFSINFPRSEDSFFSRKRSATSKQSHRTKQNSDRLRQKRLWRDSRPHHTPPSRNALNFYPPRKFHGNNRATHTQKCNPRSTGGLHPETLCSSPRSAPPCSFCRHQQKHAAIHVTTLAHRGNK